MDEELKKLLEDITRLWEKINIRDEESQKKSEYIWNIMVDKNTYLMALADISIIKLEQVDCPTCKKMQTIAHKAMFGEES